MNRIEEINQLLSSIEYFGNVIVYENSICGLYDIYYNDHGHPKYVHDEYGGDAVSDFVYLLMKEIIKKMQIDQNKIYRIDCAAFAVKHNDINPSEFVFDYKGIKHNILKKTIQINQL